MNIFGNKFPVNTALALLHKFYVPFSLLFGLKYLLIFLVTSLKPWTIQKCVVQFPNIWAEQPDSLSLPTSTISPTLLLPMTSSHVREHSSEECREK